MRLSVLSIAIAAALSLSGCATMLEGTDQRLTVNTLPAGAGCVGTRQGESHLFAVRGGDAVTVSKSRHPIEIVCQVPGMEGRLTVESQLSPVSIASPLWDAASGAMFAYPDAVSVKLVPVQ